MAQRMTACTPCHGAQGVARPDGYYPRIAGKPEGYLHEQLLNFQQGRRRHEVMQHLVRPLSEGYLLDIATHFAQLDLPHPPPERIAVTPALEARGRELIERGDARLGLPACAACHGRALTGLEPTVPGLLGLSKDYLTAQLGAWRTGLRHAREPDCMAQISRRLSDADIHAVSSVLASQAVATGRSRAAPSPTAWRTTSGRITPTATAPSGDVVGCATAR